MKFRSPVLSLRTRSAAVVGLILFAAGILITYFNSVTAQRMELRDSQTDAELMAAEFNLTSSSSQEADIQTLMTNANLALRLNHDVQSVGFYRKVGPDSVSLVALVGRDLSDGEVDYAKSGLKKDMSSSFVILDYSLYYYSKLFQSDNKVWGYALIKISLEDVRQIVLRNWITGVGITSVVSFVSSILLLFAIRLTFLRPFGDLANAMREAAAGKMDTRLSITSGTEFRDLSSIFNRMMNELQKAHEIIRSEVKQREDYNLRLQNEISIAIDALHEKSSEIISLQEKLRTFESQAALGKIASKLAHELGSPLNAIYTSVQLLMENELPQDEKKKLTVIERQVESMIGIINSLLQARKIAMPAKQDVVVSDLVEETRIVMEPRLKGKPIELNIKIENRHTMINADHVQVQQVLINLLNNSIESIETKNKSASPGRIELDVHEDLDFRMSDSGYPNIRFDVSDNGCGVPQEIVPQLFNDFIDSKKPNGNGIGLVICKEIVDKHGGKIFLSRNSKTGSAFSVILPTVKIKNVTA
ncbi:MAG TPA: ATP-binding protein [Candidatus Acidoferrales bacterium]|nr:ATP-binding protein [Candidatus Acidoferrales bacterium]